MCTPASHAALNLQDAEFRKVQIRRAKSGDYPDAVQALKGAVAEQKRYEGVLGGGYKLISQEAIDEVNAALDAIEAAANTRPLVTA